jgi:uncharacterized protein
MSPAAAQHQVDARKFFAQQADYQARFKLSLFPRLRELLVQEAENSSMEIRAELQFRRDDQGGCFIRGRIRVQLALACQRCLQSVPYPIDSELHIQVVENLQEAGDRELNPDELELVVSEQGKLDLLSLIEDELILSLPIVIYHEAEDCNQALTAFREAETRHAFEDGRKPFAELAGLKKQLQAQKRKLKSLDDLENQDPELSE